MNSLRSYSKCSMDLTKSISCSKRYSCLKGIGLENMPHIQNLPIPTPKHLLHLIWYLRTGTVRQQNHWLIFLPSKEYFFSFLLHHSNKPVAFCNNSLASFQKFVIKNSFWIVSNIEKIPLPINFHLTH